MRIAIIGGGPGGLYFAALAKQLDPRHEITVWERNAADDTFGFGVVFSDETLGGIEHADPVVHAAMEKEFARWDDIDVRYRGETVTSGGHGFAAMGRKRLLQILQERCLDLGVDVRFSTLAPDVEELRRTHDLVVAADGLNSAVRARYAEHFGPDLDVRNCRYMWLGTDTVFEAFTFDIRATEHGVMQMHGYPFDANGSTFIVEMHDDVWQRAGFSECDLPPGRSDEAAVAAVTEIFADVLAGGRVLANNSRWVRFTTVRNARWRHGNVVLLGDAAHTAHFSIGSGTKLAMEDALALAACLHEAGTDAAVASGAPSAGSGGGATGTGDPAVGAAGLATIDEAGASSALAAGTPGTVGAAGAGATSSAGAGVGDAAGMATAAVVEAALAAYEAERRPVVESTQRAAQASLDWFENIGQYVHQEPLQFAFNILTRSRRITYENLQLRDPEFVASVDAWFAEHTERDAGRVRGRGDSDASADTAPDAARAGAAASVDAGRSAGSAHSDAVRTGAEAAPTPPMFQPFRLGELELVNRVVVSPMDMYSAVDGMPTDFHLVHLGGKALGGAGLVMTEMVCVSPEGRITPGCTGMWTDEQAAAWQRVCDFVHASSRARIGLQLGHSGPKGSTKLMWEGIDQPLEDGNWPVVAASARPYREGVNQIPAALDRAGMDAIVADFVAATRRADQAGFDLVELHCAHGYLLSTFLSPVTNRRTDAYGGPVENRLRFPLEVFAAMRAVWPAHKPMTVRVSATDWVEGGITLADTLAVAHAFEVAGAAAIDVSSGQVTPDEQPAFGRSYQTPFADAIRNVVGVPTIAVGVISSAADVNTTVLAGRADLCAVGRAHLYDPSWTLHAAVEQDYDGPGAVWPAPWRAGRRKPQTGRTDGPKPRLELIRAAGQADGHLRWRPQR